MQNTIELFVRLGYLAKAVVYLLVGALALKIVVGLRGGRITDQGGALYEVLRQPMGTTLLLILAVGLLAYAAWQILAALFSWGRNARDGWGARALTIIRALVYGAIGFKGLKLALGLRGGDSGPEPLVREALTWPFGKWLVLAAGIGAAWYGLVEIKDAIKGELEPDLDGPTLRSRAGNWALQVARCGVFARGLVLVILGAGVILAAAKHRPSAAGGIDSSLSILNSLPQGSLLLGITAAGLLAYGFYQFLHARYAQI